VVRGGYPAVADALDWLSSDQVQSRGGGRLTGTGGCCFAEIASRELAQVALQRVPAGLDAFVARGLNRSPLLARLAGEPPA
jgi:4-diphosphocytidyl-2-C-methyl-D-erythritol kinase